jgi:hypothetical protein
MAALTTLEGLADGTDVALRIGGSTVVQHWKVERGGLRREDSLGETWVDPFFISGYLAQGDIFLKDFSPPVVGEWFTNDSGDHLLVVAADPVEPTTAVAMYRHGYFRAWRNEGDVVGRLARCDPPEWASTALAEMAQEAHKYKTETERLAETARRFRNARAEVGYAQQNLENAMRCLDGRG